MPSEPISSISGVGPGLAHKFERLNIRTKLDLVLHLPKDYQDRTRITPLSHVIPNQHFYVQGVIRKVSVNRRSNRSNLVVHISDQSGGFLRMRLFHFRDQQVKDLREDKWLRLYGRVQWGKNSLEMIHPEYQVFVDTPRPIQPELTPVYRGTKGLSSRQIRGFIIQALGEATFLPKFKYQSITLGEAIKKLHSPSVNEQNQIDPARQRVAFDEILAYLLLQQRRRLQRKTLTTSTLATASSLSEQFRQSLNFTLTQSQQQVIKEILGDLGQKRPMLRLLQGDVGSGKTVVAAHAMIRAAENRVQTALMAPTELLAEQHYETLSEWLDPLGIRVGLLTGQMSARTRKVREQAIAEGDDLVVIGTHALFQKSVRFHSLGLTIIDEQHRFGVHQRMLLRDKGRLPHQLIMTATPIPRTLTLYLFTDMDVSKILELPPGRQPITTTVHGPSQRQHVIEAVHRHVGKGHQAYWVCAAIDEQDSELPLMSTADVEREFQARRESVRVKVLHGQMKSDEKRIVMNQFRTGSIDVLIATTVIEVGVDVPNASLMVIDNADHMGLAQLHQLRGRVGRGSIASYCMLCYATKLSSVQQQRLAALKTMQDGFELAELDLQLRGPGEVFGTKQSGELNFKVAQLERDYTLFQSAAPIARQLSEEDPDLAGEIISTWSPYERDYAAV